MITLVFATAFVENFFFIRIHKFLRLIFESVIQSLFNPAPRNIG